MTDLSEFLSQINESNPRPTGGKSLLLKGMMCCSSGGISGTRTLDEAPEQIGGTCYANATAMAVTSCQQRITGRTPNFSSTCIALINRFGYDGANMERALQFAASTFRVTSRSTSVQGVIDALRAGRKPLIRFQLRDSQWTEFSAFYRNSPKGVLRAGGVHVSSQGTGDDAGHACCIQDYDEDTRAFVICNSWGKTFADKGFFRVSIDHPLPGTKFFDVYVSVDDLSAEDVAAFKATLPQSTQKANDDAIAGLEDSYRSANGAFQTGICTALRTAMSHARKVPTVTGYRTKWPWSSWFAS